MSTGVTNRHFLGDLKTLADVDVDAVTDTQHLAYNVTLKKWVPVPAGGGGASTLGGLDNVNVSADTPGGGEYLRYNAGGGEWFNTTGPVIQRLDFGQIGFPGPTSVSSNGTWETVETAGIFDSTIEFVPGFNSWEAAYNGLSGLKFLTTLDVEIGRASCRERV